MQSFLKKMLLWACMLVPLITMAQGFNYSCDFEDANDSQEWTFVNGTATNRWYIGQSAHNGGGTNGLYISDSVGEINRYNTGSRSKALVYHTMTLSAGNYEYFYDWKCSGEGRWDFMRVVLAPATVELMADVNNGITYNGLPSGWIALDGGMNLSGSTMWNSVSGSVSIPTDGSYNLIVYWENDYSSGSQPPAAIDNISFVLPMCATPSNVVVSDIVDDMATISWTEMGSASSWIVECVPSGMEIGSPSGIVQVVSETSCVVVGLEYNTQYDVYVQADCGVTQSFYARGSFRSACGTMVIPYIEDFESSTINMAPFCWTVINNSNVKVTTRGGSNKLRFAAGGAIATPKIPLAGNSIEIDFGLQREGAQSGSIEVGFVTDLSHMEDMMVIKTFSPMQTNAYTDISCDVDFSVMGENATDEGYIVFRQIEQTSIYYYYWIDNINIHPLSDCRRPAEMHAENIAYDGATLKWTSVLEESEYEVVYGLVNDIEANDNIHVMNVHADSINVTNLLSNTKYYMWVRQLCEDGSSEWRFGGSFMTDVRCATLLDVMVTSVTSNGASMSWTFNSTVGLPATSVEVSYRAQGSTDPFVTATTSNNYYMFTGLEGGTIYEYRLQTLCNEDRSDIVTGTFVTNPCGVTIAGGESVTEKFPTYTYDDYSYTQMLYNASELVGLDTIRGVSFRYADGTDGSVTRTVDIYVGHTDLNVLGSEPVWDSMMTKVGSNVALHINKGWSTMMFDSVFVYDGTSNIVVAIDDNTGDWEPNQYVYYHAGGPSLYTSSWRGDIVPSTTTQMSSFMGVPDIIFCTSCNAAGCAEPLVSVVSKSSSDVNVVWAPGGTDNQWVVEYKLTTENVWNVFETTTNTFSTINGLLPGSFYDIRIGSLCGEDTLFTNATVVTECAAVAVPYSENFNYRDLNPCIIIGNETPNVDLPFHIYDYIKFPYHTNGYIILPEIGAEINTLRMSCYLSADYDNSQVIVYVGTDNTNMNSFVPVDTISITDNNENGTYLTYFNNYVGTGHYIAIRAVSSHISLDDILIETMPTCAVAMDVEVSQVTSETAELSWNGSMGSSDGWIISCVNISQNDTIEISTDTTTYSLTDLIPDTKYQIKVYNICGGDTIESLYPIYFRTQCGTMEFPFVESFENKEVGVFPTCWTALAGTNKISGYEGFTWFGENSLELSKDGMVASPKVPLYGSNIAVDFLLKRKSENSGKIAVGFMTDLMNMSTLTIVDTIDPIDDEIHQYEMDFSSLNTFEEGYVVWKQIDRSTTSPYRSEYYLDYVFIREISDCERLQEVTVSGVTYNQALISWDAIEGTTEYEVMYGKVNDFTSSENSIISVWADSVYLSNLEDNTTYYVWVRNVCGGGYSDWRAAQFTTQISCAMLADVTVDQVGDSEISLTWAYTENVGIAASSTEVKWKTINDSNYTSIVTNNTYYIIGGLQSRTSYQIELRTICGNDTSEATRMSVTTNVCGVIVDGGESDRISSSVPSSCSWSYSYAQMLYPAYDLMGVDTIRTIAFEGNSNAVESRNWDIYMAHTNNVSLDAQNALPSTAFTLVGSNVTFNYVEGWCVIDLTTPFIYNNDSNLVIAIDDNTGDYADDYLDFRVHDGCAVYVRNDYDNLEPSNLLSFRETNVVPNISFVEPCDDNACNAPLLIVTGTTETTASLVWSRANANETWHVEYKLATDTSWTIVDTNAMNAYATITNLQPSRYYDFRVGTNCSDSVRYAMVQGLTDCGAVTIPYCENFEVPNLNPCWVYGNIQEGVDAPYLSDGALYMNYYTNGYAILPEFVDDISTLRVSFSIESNTENNNVVIAIGTDPTDINTFITMDTFTVTTADVELSQEYDLDAYTGTGHYIAFISPTGHVYLDNIDIRLTIPICEMPTNLTVSDITSSSANISWEGTADSYDVEYCENGDTNWTSVIVNGNNLALTNLQSFTIYQWRVRANCGDPSGLSEWALSTFKTAEYICPIPTNLVTNVEGNSVTIDWDVDEEQSSWEVIVYNIDTITVMTTEHPIVVEHLDGGGVTYAVEVRAICADNVYSEWAELVEFTTETCEPVSNVVASEITANSAKISWTANGSEDKWQISYGDAEFGQGQGSMVEATTTSYTLMNLTPTTEYDVYVRAACGSDFNSIWSTPVCKFITLEGEPEGIDGINGDYQLMIYPNPTSSATTIQLSGVEGKVMISVVDMNGRTLVREDMECGSDCEKRLDVAGLAQGTYFVRVLGDNINSVRKLIVR